MTIFSNSITPYDIIKFFIRFVSFIENIIFTSIFYGLSSHYDKVQIDTWNNGICTECGGEYKFKNAYNSSYFYACEDCDHVIKLEELKK